MASVFTKEKTTIGVNAAFLQEVKESNLQLWSTLRDLRDIQPDTGDAIEASRVLVDQLGELRECIGLQFSLEETYGYIEAPRATLPAFGSADASVARMQHCELYLQLHELCEQAEEAQYRGTISRDLSKFLEAFAAFDDCFRAHEELETELIRCGLGLSRH